MSTRNISVASDFSEYPALRHCNLSDDSGEDFYHSVLNKAFKEAFENKHTLIVNLDGTDGYASSFLDEAFGNLVYDFALENVKNTLEIISLQQPHWKKMLLDETFVQWEKRRTNNEHPEVTKEHAPWYRLDNNGIKLDIWEHPNAFA